MCSVVNQVQPVPIVLIPMGNRWRGDDAVGPAVYDLLADELCRCDSVRVVNHVDDAMTILSAWEGAQQVLIVDAAVTGAKPGTIHRFGSGEQPIPHDIAAFSGHGLGLAEAIELGRALGRLPKHLVGWAIEAGHFATGEPMSDAVSAATFVVAQQIRIELSGVLNAEKPNA